MMKPEWEDYTSLHQKVAFEKNDDGMEEKWLKQLVTPGSSLGGARPKASEKFISENFLRKSSQPPQNII